MKKLILNYYFVKINMKNNEKLIPTAEGLHTCILYTKKLRWGSCSLCDIDCIEN